MIVANDMISMDNSETCISGTINCTDRILKQCKLIIRPIAILPLIIPQKPNIAYQFLDVTVRH